jgi:hypothetical protein
MRSPIFSIHPAMGTIRGLVSNDRWPRWVGSIRARGIIRRKLIYNQLFKLAIAFGGPVWIVDSFESFFSALLYESDLLYSGGGGKKQSFVAR